MRVCRNVLNGACEAFFFCGETAFFPSGVLGVLWDTYREGAPARAEIELLDGGTIPLSEGDRAVLSVGGEKIFCGYVFQKIRDCAGRLRVVCYDQLRYLKNRDSYVFSYKTAAEIIKNIADDHGLVCGELEDTGYRIPSLAVSSASMIDIIADALDITESNTGREFVLLDDRGKLELCSPQNLVVEDVLTEGCAESFELRSSIDLGVYNKVKVCKKRENGREIAVASDEELIKKWGELQLLSNSGKVADAAALLRSRSSPQRVLKIENARGDARVRGGVAVGVDVDLGGETLRKFVRVEHARHKFRGGLHLMTLSCSVLI